MFVGWIREDSLSTDLDTLSQELLIDKNIILNTFQENPSLSFGVYDKEKLSALISAFEYDNSILINGFYYLETVSTEIKNKLLDLLLENISDKEKTILFLANQNELEIFKQFEFKPYCEFLKATYKGGAVFNFTNATAKTIMSENYGSVIKKLDKDAFKEDRYNYIMKTLMKQSSLMLATGFGYQHSYALNKSNIKISPFIMVDEAFSDAEKLLRAVLYHRGLKTIFTFVPKNVKEIVDLYENYNFELTSGYNLLYKNKKPNIHLNSVYGF